MSNSDVRAKRVTAAASLGVGPARIRQVQVLTTADGAGRLTITDGSGGATLHGSARKAKTPKVG
jgi:hypothetical protein